MNSWNLEHPEKLFEVEGLPGYEDFLTKGIGAFLLPLPQFTWKSLKNSRFGQSSIAVNTSE